jgi:glycerol-3-phosphate dehydrogenase
VNAAFPSARLSAADVVSAYAGLRPLVDTGEGEESDISRSHEVLLDEDGLVTVAGGKLTTGRSMAEEVLDLVASRLPPKGTDPRDTLSARIEDPGASDPPDVLAAIPRIAREEMPVHLDDVMVRRTWAFHEAEDHGLDLAPEIANALAAELGWDPGRRGAELGRYRQIVEAHRRWREERHG